MRIAVLASHGGSLLQAVIDACRSGAIRGTVVLVISNNGASGALRRAKTAGIAYRHLSSKTHPDARDLDCAIANALDESRTDLGVLAGYMKRLGPITLGRYSGRIVNTHPALLPKYGGHGFYGSKVHAAVLTARDTWTGATVHYVEGDYDSGPVIAQRSIRVLPDESLESLESRVKLLERGLLVETLGHLAAKRDADSLVVRPLRADDADAYRRIRLSALAEEPTAFSASYEVELAQPETFRQRLASHPDRFVLGAFFADRLVGIVGLYRESGPKRRHAATVVSMFVSRSERGRGIGRRLLTEVIVRASTIPGLEQLELSVTSGNHSARRLYEALGFAFWGTQPHALRVGNEYFAEDHMVLRLPSARR